MFVFALYVLKSCKAVQSNAVLNDYYFMSRIMKFETVKAMKDDEINFNIILLVQITSKVTPMY